MNSQVASREASTAELSVEAFRPIAYSLAGLGVGLNLWGAIAFPGLVPQHPELLYACLFGLALQLGVVVLLAAGGPVDLLTFASVADYALFGILPPIFGTGADFHLYIVVMSFVSLTFLRWPVWLRAILVLLPLLVFAFLHVGIDVPPSTGIVSDRHLRDLQAFNLIAISLLSLVVVLRGWRLLEAARAQAERLAEARSRLIDDMSHELRTPLAILLTAAQSTLEKDREGEVYRRAFALVERQVRSLGKMVEKMLEMGWVERGEIEVVESDDLIAAINAIAGEYETLAAARGLEVEIVAPPCEGKTDAALLRVVLGNLLENAIRFSPEGGKIEIRLVEEGGGRKVTVRDFGPGIAKEDLPFVFQRYWRADRARSRRQDHHGLGLALARRYARHLGATLEVESEEGAGATFTIRW